MVKKITIKGILISLLILFTFSTVNTLANNDKKLDETPSNVEVTSNNSINDDDAPEVTLIYVHGILNSDFMSSFNNANIMYEKLRGQKIGPYRVKNYKIAFWGAIARNNETFKRYYEGLTQINSKHNRKHSVTNTLNPANIVTAPIKTKNPTMYCSKNLYNKNGISLYNKGSDQSAISMRYYTNDFAYDLIWLLSKDDIAGQVIDGIKYSENDISNNLEAVYNKIEDQINQTNGKYILVGDSAGCIAAIKFVIDRLNVNSDYNKIIKESNSEKVYNSNEAFYSDNFVGLITIASPINTFLSGDLNIAYQEYEDPKRKERSFINYILNDKIPGLEYGRFWVNIGHRNDPIATDISRRITDLKGHGLIASTITKATLKEKFWAKLNLIKMSDSDVLKAHRWYLNNWEKVLFLINEDLEPLTNNTNTTNN